MRRNELKYSKAFPPRKSSVRNYRRYEQSLLLACCNRILLLGLSKQIVYLLVRGLREVFVPVANTIKRLWCLSAHDLIYLGAKLLTCRRSRYRHRDHNTSGMLPS